MNVNTFDTSDKDPGADQMQVAKAFIHFLQGSNQGQTGQKSNLRVKNVTDKRSRQSSNKEWKIQVYLTELSGTIWQRLTGGLNLNIRGKTNHWQRENQGQGKLNQDNEQAYDQQCGQSPYRILAVFELYLYLISEIHLTDPETNLMPEWNVWNVWGCLNVVLLRDRCEWDRAMGQ